MSEMGWCHQCGTLQLWADAPRLVVAWADDDVPERCCIVCRESEPWSLAVFPLEDQALRSCCAANHVTWSPGVCESCLTGRDLRETWVH